ncbi:MAG: integrase core domain-containing protein [Polyangia bacterium]
MKRTVSLVVVAVCILTAPPASAGFRYDPVYAPQICTYFQRDAGRSMNDRYDPSSNFKQTRLYIEGLPLPEVWEDHADEIHTLARAEGMLKFRDELRRNDWLHRGYAWDDLLQDDEQGFYVPLSDEAIYWAFVTDEDKFEGEGLDAVGDDWPVLYWDSLTGEADCSGVMIGPNHYLTAGHCVTIIYDRLAEGYDKYNNFYYPAHGYDWPEAGATEQEKADIMCGLTEVAFDFRVKWSDLPWVDKGYGFPVPVTSIEDLAFLSDDDWRSAFRAARDRQKSYKCKKAYPVFYETSPMDYVVMELDGAPGVHHGWMDVSSEPPGTGSFHAIIVGHPSGCPQMLSLGISPGASGSTATMDVSAYATSGFSGSPTLFSETGKIEGSISQGIGLAEYYPACIDADVTSCEPQWVDGSQTFNCGDDRLNVLLVIDLHTREILELQACDAWGPTSEWTIRTFAGAMHREDRRPEAVVHDHGTPFLGQFERQLRVLEIERRRTPVALPFVNGTAERAIKSVRLEMLNHVRVLDVKELQWYLDEYRLYYNEHRVNQAIGGQTPAAFGRGSPDAEVISLDEVRQRKLVRTSFANGLLNTYELVEGQSDAA